MDKGKAKKPPQKFVVALLLAAGALMLLLGVKGERASASAADTPDDLQAYCAYLEKRAEALAESVYGVSDVKVVVTLEGGAKKAVCNELTALLSAAFGIGMNKIYISPSD